MKKFMVWTPGRPVIPEIEIFLVSGLSADDVRGMTASSMTAMINAHRAAILADSALLRIMKKA